MPITVTYDGLNIFGAAVKAKMEVNPSASQINNFFSVTGQEALYGGGRGRVFLVDAVFVAPDPPSLQSLIANLLSYDDGVGRVFYHDVYGPWDAVIFRKFQPGELKNVGVGLVLPYKAQFDGLL